MGRVRYFGIKLLTTLTIENGPLFLVRSLHSEDLLTTLDGKDHEV